MVQLAVDNFGGLDLAINNAGVMDGVYSGEANRTMPAEKDLVFARLIESMTDGYWENVIRTNVTGTWRKTMRAELRQMVAQGRGGAIVNVGSIAGLTGLAGNPAYVATKHAVNGMTRNAAVDYAPYGIRVNSVNMAATDTPMVARAGASGRRPRWAILKGLRQIGSGEDPKPMLAYAEAVPTDLPRSGRTGCHDAVSAVARGVQPDGRVVSDGRRLDGVLSDSVAKLRRHVTGRGPSIHVNFRSP